MCLTSSPLVTTGNIFPVELCSTKQEHVRNVLIRTAVILQGSVSRSAEALEE